VKIKNIFFDKKLIYIAVVFIIILGLLLSLYFFFNKKPQISPQVYKGSTFEIEVPEGWSVATTSAIYKDFTVISPNKKLKANRDVFKINEPMIYVVSRDSGTTTLQEYVEQLKPKLVPGPLSNDVHNYKIIEEVSTTTADNISAYLVGTYFETADTQPKDINEIINAKNLATPTPRQPKISKYKNLSLITIKDEKLYVVTATAPEEKWSEFDEKYRKTLINFNP